jgi:protein ImuA
MPLVAAVQPKPNACKSAPSQPRNALNLQALGLWRAHELAGSSGVIGRALDGAVSGVAAGVVLPTGFAALDAQLPGGGWPLGAMVELLQDQALRHEWALLLPALVARLQGHAGPLVLVGQGRDAGLAGQPCVQAFVPALAAQGLPSERLLWVHAGTQAAQLWAAEQALRCAQVAAVVLWLNAGVGAGAGMGAQQSSTSLRRLHLAAQSRGQLLFVLRPARARTQASPAPLRLLLSGADAVQVQLLKRRGPPMDAGLQWPAGSARMQALLAAMRARAPVPTPAPVPGTITLPTAISRLIAAAQAASASAASATSAAPSAAPSAGQGHALDRA